MGVAVGSGVAVGGGGSGVAVGGGGSGVAVGGGGSGVVVQVWWLRCGGWCRLCLSSTYNKWEIHVLFTLCLCK